MEYKALDQKKELYEKENGKDKELLFKKYEENFLVRFVHESTSMEGNTLTLAETKVVLIDGMSVERPIADVNDVYHNWQAFGYAKRCIRHGEELGRKIVMNMARLLMDRPLCNSLYREENVYISGSDYEPPDKRLVPVQMDKFYEDISQKNAACNMPEGIHPVSLAAYTHAQFVHIHPFIDFNGRTARLLMNYQLMSHGFLPVSISRTRLLRYYNALETYHLSGDLSQFEQLIYELEKEELDKMIQVII